MEPNSPAESPIPAPGTPRGPEERPAPLDPDGRPAIRDYPPHDPRETGASAAEPSCQMAGTPS